MNFLALLAPIFGQIVDLVAGKLGVDLNSEENRAKKLEIEREAMHLAAGLPMEQIAVNLETAKDNSIYTGGWRDLVGWGMGIAFLLPMYLKIVGVLLKSFFGINIEVPDIEIEADLLYGLLGFGGYYTADRLGNRKMKSQTLGQQRGLYK